MKSEGGSRSAYRIQQASSDLRRAIDAAALCHSRGVGMLSGVIPNLHNGEAVACTARVRKVLTGAKGKPRAVFVDDGPTDNAKALEKEAGATAISYSQI